MHHGWIKAMLKLVLQVQVSKPASFILKTGFSIPESF